MAIPEHTGSRRVVSDEYVVAGACRYFLEHSTLDMERLATAISISRATLYRIVHSRDRLLGDVLWRLAERMLAKARRERVATGVEGILEVTRRFVTRQLASEAFRQFLVTEPETAARVLFTPAGGVHVRAVAAQKEIFLEAVASPDVWGSIDLDHRAYLYVRIIESMLYAELLTGGKPDLDLAEQAARALLEQRH